MKTFKQFVAEDYIHTKKQNDTTGIVSHHFQFRTGQSPNPVNVYVHTTPKGRTGYVYIPGHPPRDANKHGFPQVRQAMGIIKQETGLNQLRGVRDSGAGPGRTQNVKI